MGKKREHLTLEQIKAQVEEEIPYVVGQGRMSIIKRERRTKELMRRHGHKIDKPGQEHHAGPKPYVNGPVPRRLEVIA